MGSRASTHNDLPEAEQLRQVKKQATRAEFGRRLSRAMVLKGLSQAELSKKATAKAPGGMRIGPDSISHYINGRYMPSPAHLKVLAEVLQIDPVELLPAGDLPEAGESLPPISVQDLGNGTAWVKVNQAVEWTKAVKVLSILRGEE